MSRRHGLAPVLMMAPAAIFSILMIGFPFAYAFYLSLTNFRLGTPDPPEFIGLGNFINAFKDPVFYTALRVTLVIYVVALVLEVVLGTYIGILLGRRLRGGSLMRMLAYAPAIVPSVAVGLIFVQMFDVALGSWVGQHNLCVFSPTCGNALALEHNGDLYSCDHFVEPNYLLGNIQETHMLELIASDRQRQFGKNKLKLEQ